MRFIYWDNKEWVRGGDKIEELIGVRIDMYVFWKIL